MTTGSNHTADTRQDDLRAQLRARVHQQIICAQVEQYAAAYDADAGLARFTGNTREDDLLARVYQQVIGAQAEQYAAAYDADAGLARFTGWLQEHTAGELGADQAMAELYSLHYQPLVRLAIFLVRDVESAKDVVRDSFTATRDARRQLRDPENALAYLRRAVVNQSRSVLRHRTIAAKDLQEAPPVIAALSRLPERQREAIVLRYYADLSEGQIAAAMGISRRAVNRHTARGMSALRAALE